MADLDTLRMLAGKASSAPWFMHDFTDPLINLDPTAADVTVSCDHPASITVAAMGGGLDGFQGVNQARFDAAYIAACDPQTILALLDENERLREALQLTSGALQVFANIYPLTTPFRFNGEWEHLGEMSVEAILDKANAELGPHP